MVNTMKVLGIDIGTTSICAVVLESTSGDVLEAVNTDNGAFIKTAAQYERIQDPAIILAQVKTLADSLCEKYAPIAGIGVSGQMHGIVYLDSAGTAVSPLYTWQDARGDIPKDGGKTYAQTLSASTEYKLASGFGAVTHYYNTINSLVPENAAVFCTIHDYAAMTLAGRQTPLTHSSDAASFGLFDLSRGAFDEAAIRAAGMNVSLFPGVTNECEILGTTPGGIPVCVALGDNQASVAGSVAEDESTVLVNIGTGSQISLLSKEPSSTTALETRPFNEGAYLQVGSSLCGGRAFALLEGFFRSVVNAAGFECDSMYPAMDRLSEGFELLENPLQVATLFCGTRENPDARASISNLGTDNFTPEHLVAGVLWGTINELYDKYAAGGHAGKAKTVVASGNGVRKSPVMRRMLEMKFGTTVKIPRHKEEAAYGAALFAMAGAGVFPSLAAARSIIRYD